MRLPRLMRNAMGLDFPLRRCGCGQHGCIENYLSGRGFAWLYQHNYHQPLQAPKLLRFMIKAMSRQGRTLSVIWIY